MSAEAGWPDDDLPMDQAMQKAIDETVAEATKAFRDALNRVPVRLRALPPQPTGLPTYDEQVNLVKACEHIAEGTDGWQKLRNECPSTAAVASLRDAYESFFKSAQPTGDVGELVARLGAFYRSALNSEMMEFSEHWLHELRGILDEAAVAITALNSRTARLEQERDDLSHLYKRVVERAEAAEARVAVLEKVLERYGKHDDGCEDDHWHGKGPMLCSCGLRAALTEPAQEK